MHRRPSLSTSSDLTAFLQDTEVLQFLFLEVYLRAAAAAGGFRNPSVKLIKRQLLVSTDRDEVVVFSNENFEASTIVFGQVLFGMLLKDFFEACVVNFSPLCLPFFFILPVQLTVVLLAAEL